LFHEKGLVGHIKLNLRLLGFPVLFQSHHVIFCFPQRHGLPLLELYCVVDDGRGTLHSLRHSVLLYESLNFVLVFTLLVLFLLFHLISPLVLVSFKLLSSSRVLLLCGAFSFFAGRSLIGLGPFLLLHSRVDHLVFMIKVASEFSSGFRQMEGKGETVSGPLGLLLAFETHLELFLQAFEVGHGLGSGRLERTQLVN
jgi:hypothetical protein